MGNRQVTTTSAHDPYQLVGIGGGGNQNLLKIIRILTITAAKPCYFRGIMDIGGGDLSVPDIMAACLMASQAAMAEEVVQAVFRGLCTNKIRSPAPGGAISWYSKYGYT